MTFVAIKIAAGILVWAIGAIVVAQYTNKDIQHRRAKGVQMYGVDSWADDAEHAFPVLVWPVWPVLKFTWYALVFIYKFPKRFGEWLWVKVHYSELIQDELKGKQPREDMWV